MPEIIKKHTHTRTIFKHHFVKPKATKAIPILPLPPPSGLPRGLTKNHLWRPSASASEYRASELNYVPKKISINKKKNPFKILEALAEAQAEGHQLRPHVIKKVRHHDDASDSSEYVPDYMLVDNPRYNRDDSYSGPSADDSSSLIDSSSKTDLIYAAPQDKHKKKHSNTYYTSRDYASPSVSSPHHSKKKTKSHAVDWQGSSASSSLTSSSTSDSEYVPEHRHLTKVNKSRKPKRMSPTLGPSEEHISILQRTRKHRNPITNYTKYKNRLNGGSSLNTSI